MIFRIFMIVLLALTTKNSYANSSFSYVNINALAVHDNFAEILIELKEPSSNGEGCSNNQQLVLRKSHPMFKEMYATILLAFSMDKPISGWVNGCVDWVKSPLLTRLDLKK